MIRKGALVMSITEEWRKHKQTVGCVTTDAHFHMQYADADYFRYFGDDVIYSILRTIHETDSERLVQVAHQLRDGQLEQLVLRMRGRSTDWCWMLVWLTAHGEGAQRQYQLRITDVFRLQQMLMDTARENTTYRFYLSLMRDLTFRYSFRTRHICIVVYDCCRERILTDMLLEDWKQQAIEKGMVAREDISKLETLCSNMEHGEPRFQCELETSLCSMGSRMEYCMFRGVTRSDLPGERTVLGTISFLHAKFKSKEPSWLQETQRDPATDLLNKNAITAYAKSVLATQPEGIVSLVILNVDAFKEINDRYGHMFGDEVLFTMAQILQSEIGNRGVAGRIGGGMFLFVLEGIADETDLRGVLRAIRTKLEWAWENTGEETGRPRVTCSMGAACYPIDSKSYDALFLQADKALYIATEKGNNRYVIYDVKKHGAALPNSERSTADLYANVPKSMQSKAGFVADVARSLLHQPLPDVFALLQGIGEQFGVDGIHIFATVEQKAVFSWGHPVNGAANVLLAEPFSVGFGEDDVCVVDNINALENVADDAYHWFAAQNMLGAVLYRMMQGEAPVGVIAFGLFGRFRKWSTLDVNHLTVLGGILAGLMESYGFSQQIP